MKKKVGKYVLVIGAVVVALLMVSSATAVPYTRQEPLSLKINEMEGKLKEFRDNPLFTKLQTLSKEKYDPERTELATDIVQRLLERKNIDIEATDDEFFPFLILIVDIILLIFGHNVIGKTLALLVTSIIAIPYSFVLGFPMMAAWASIAFIMFMIVYVLATEVIEELLKDLFDLSDFWHYYGLILGSIILSTGVIIILLCLPLIYLLGVGASYIMLIQEVLEHLSTKTSI